MSFKAPLHEWGGKPTLTMAPMANLIRRQLIFLQKYYPIVACKKGGLILDNL